MIQDIIQDYNDQIDHKNIKLSYKSMYSNKYDKKGEIYENKKRYNDIPIFTDKIRINQVISNLLNNAIKFTDKGFIDIIIEKKGDDGENKVLINVKDSGFGIDQSIIPKLFSKFTTKSNGGTGLGLFISKKIIEAHG